MRGVLVIDHAVALAAADAIEIQLEALRGAIGESTPTDAQLRHLAREFCRLNDDAQARFFVEVARLMQGWGDGKADAQAYFIGRHLATCDCATSEARELVQGIAAAIEQKTP